IIETSTDGGATWTAPTPAYTCMQNGDPDCTTSVNGVSFPDQEHIAVDRWNVTAGGDQVYSASHIGFPNYWGIVCSTDSATTWSANTYISVGGAFPRITVGADGFVYVVYTDSGNIMLDKFRSCETQSDPMTSQPFFPVTVRANFVDVACPMPGLNRCNNGNRLTSPVVAVDDTDPNHIYVSYANNTNPGDGSNCTNQNQNLCDEDVIVQDSLDGGSTWPAGYVSDFCVLGSCFDSMAACSDNLDCFDPDRTVTLSSGVTARRFMPWVCAVGGEAYVSWYDRRAAFPGGTMVSNNSLTDYYYANAFLDANGALTAGPEVQVTDLGTADPQCEGGFPTGSPNSWPNGTRATGDSDSCSVQPQLAGICCLPAEVSGIGRCSNPVLSSQNRCDFDTTPAGTPPCLATEVCAVNSGSPKYGDYNGNACGAGRVHLTWASSVAPLAFPPATDIDSFYSSKIVCCVPQIQVPGDVNFGQVCGLEQQTAELNVCNTGKEDLEVVSITSDEAQFAVTQPLAGWPVDISPDFCFPFEVTYDPDGTGDDAGILTVNSNDPVNPALEVGIEGSVGEPDLNVAIADSGDFGAVCKGDHADLDLTLFNQGQCDLTIDSITSDNLLFDLPDDTQYDLKLSPDAEFTLPVRYAPFACNDAGDMGTITIESDSPGEETLEIDVGGVAPCPNLVIDPHAFTEAFAFPATVVDETGTLGCFSDASTAIRNTGACPLTISDMEATGLDFAVIQPGQFPIVLPPGEETLEVVVRFTPQDDGMPLTADEITGQLTVTSDDPDGNVQAELCGEGVIQSGVRILVTDITSGAPVVVDSVDSMTVKSKGKSTPGPINLQFMDVTPVMTVVCGNEVQYHLNVETLPAVDTTGANGQSQYVANAKEGKLADNHSFTLDQCEFSAFQMELKSSDGGDGGMCLLLGKGETCTSAEQCCSGKCKGPVGGMTCK
ncbi:MAG: choice-of-anchor D domain-containing protein, partial [Lysobacterales bacterium]